MPDEPLESAPESTGQPTPPTPVISSENLSGQQPSQAPTFDIDSLTTKIAEKLNLDEVIERKLQSTKDKRFRQLESLTGDFQTMSNYLKAANNDPELAARNYRLDQLLASDVPPKNQGTVQPAGQQTMSVSDVTTILTDEELAPDDPEVVAWGQKAYPSKEAAEVALRRVAAKKRKQSTSNPAGLVMDGQRLSTSSTTPQEEREKINSELLVLMKSPNENAAKIAALKERRSKLR